MSNNLNEGGIHIGTDSQSTMVQPEGQKSQHPLANYHFSPEELRVLKECNRDSFFQRSLPLGTGLGIASYFAVKNGYLRPSVKFGAVPKVVVSVIVGYFAGKFSYQSKCAEKIMRLPNSKLGEMLKAKKKGAFYDNLTPDQGYGAGISMAPFSSQATDNYSDVFQKNNKQVSALDIDMDRPSQSGLSEGKRGNVDSSTGLIDEKRGNVDSSTAGLTDEKRGNVDSSTNFSNDYNLPLPIPESSNSYEELRKKNREDYQKKNPGYFGPPTIPSDQPPVFRGKREEDTQQQKGAKNKYGDVWT